MRKCVFISTWLLFVLMIAAIDPLTGSLSGSTWVMFHLWVPATALLIQKVRAAIIVAIFTGSVLFLTGVLQLSGLVPVQLLAPRENLLLGLLLHIIVLIGITATITFFTIQMRDAVKSALAAHRTLEQQAAILRDLSIRDPLTGLFNRRFLDETLQRQCSRSNGQSGALSIIMLDIDHFKAFNTRYGHGGGDTALRAVSGCLQLFTYGRDIACRYGGEEFMLLLFDVSLEAAVQRAEQVRQAIKQMAVCHNGEPLDAITASFGVGSFPVHGATIDAVIEAVHQAQRRAKAMGRDCVVVAECREEVLHFSATWVS